MEPFGEWLDENKEEVAGSIGPIAYARTKEEGMEGLRQMIGYRTFMEVLANTGLQKEQVRQIDEALGKIENEG